MLGELGSGCVNQCVPNMFQEIRCDSPVGSWSPKLVTVRELEKKGEGGGGERERERDREREREREEGRDTERGRQASLRK